ncbi:MAG: metal ABC transporter substrate-binding protein [Candidatus Cloacimonetes bacterium]|nr:metal ABC transporter substrate-binding protein [Candidatus Cloacimonadota bacterium]
MSNLYKLISVLFITAIMMASCSKPKTEQKVSVLCTTFPIYQITRNVVQGYDGVEVSLMLPGQLGCPHDYVLTPQDMTKLSRADILIINGLGLEEFMGAPVTKANPEIKVIDSSMGITEVIEFTDAEHEEHHHESHHDEAMKDEHAVEEHHHTGANPHMFASPLMAAKIAQNIATELAKLDPKGADTYTKNSQAYAEVLNKLFLEMKEMAASLKNKTIVQPHGVFDYLARDLGLNIAGVMQAHGQEPSAAQMMDLVKLIKDKKVGAIVTEPQYPEKVGNTLAKESGVALIKLDPVASGPNNSPLNYYEVTMRQNMLVLQQVLGKQEL